jgi:FtsP/CotA-like multicopper oxidase with cupredoxin domain
VCCVEAEEHVIAEVAAADTSGHLAAVVGGDAYDHHLPDAVGGQPSMEVVASEGDADVTREFDLPGTGINNQRVAMDRFDATAEAGATEIWELTISDRISHNFHVHGVQFQVVDVDGEPPPPPVLSGWRDTAFLRPDTTIRIAVLFGDYTDPDLPYMFHCHLVQHEDQGTMGQFVVVEPESQPATSTDTTMNPDTRMMNQQLIFRDPPDGPEPNMCPHTHERTGHQQ